MSESLHSELQKGSGIIKELCYLGRSEYERRGSAVA